MSDGGSGGSALKRLIKERRLPWKLTNACWWLKRRFLLISNNIRYRRAMFRLSSMTSLHRMIDPGKIRPGSIPVVINNFNRLDSLRQEVEWILALEGETSVIILDNQSTYTPLAEYYDSLKHHPSIQVVFLGYNSGLEGLEDMERELARFPYFVITDPDLVPYDDTPPDILGRMRDILDRHPEINHVGASIETNDIPTHYPLKQQVQEWEARYWPPEATVVEEGVFEAWVDSTFGMYRATSGVRQIDHALRLDRPYRLRHVDWYLDPENLSEEQQYYMRTSTRVASWSDKFLKSGGKGTAGAYTGPDWK